MGKLAERRERKAQAAEDRAAYSRWAGRDREFDYFRTTLESIYKYPGQGNDRTLSFVYNVRLVPRDLELDELAPIVGNAIVQTHNVMLVSADDRRLVLMSWQFAECEELVVTDDDRVVAFVTGRDDGSELVMLLGPDDKLGWLARVGWTCHREGVDAAMRLIDAMQHEHRLHRPGD